MTSHGHWTLRTEHTSHTVRLSPDGPWAELEAWGPPGVEDGPSALDWSHHTHFITPAEYLPQGQRPFTGADLIVGRSGHQRGVWWQFAGVEQDADGLRRAFTDTIAGPRTTLCYAIVPGTDVIRRAGPDPDRALGHNACGRPQPQDRRDLRSAVRPARGGGRGHRVPRRRRSSGITGTRVLSWTATGTS